MNQFVKATLEKQMAILVDVSGEIAKSDTLTNARDLPAITAQIIQLAKLLDPELRNQSYAAALQSLPYASLTMSDLEEITAARKEKLRRSDDALRLLLDELHACPS